jgi:hypothetical protein
MDLSYPLRNVTIRQAHKVLRVKDPLKVSDNWQVSQNEFAMQIDGVGDFYVMDGKYVEFSPFMGADPEWVRLHLNGRVMVVLLHQRKILNFHASSFIHDDRGIMLLGETGTGKSSLTASFTMEGAGFLSDDLTPVIFKKSTPYLLPISGSIKIRENTAGQLNINRNKLIAAESGTGKHYLHVNHAGVQEYILNNILKIEIGNNDTTEFYKLQHAEKFSLLRSEICSWEILAGMPETEAEYLQQLLNIVQQVNFVKVVRPFEIEIQVLHSAIADYLRLCE